MSNWQYEDDQTEYYELAHWFDSLKRDPDSDGDYVNGVHVDDLQEALYSLLQLLCGLDILVNVDTSDGEPAIWMKKRRR